MNKVDYKALDEAILQRIREGHSRASAIEGGDAEAEARKLSSAKVPEYRIIDRRLQALRKAGRIAYEKTGGWSVVTLPA